MGPKVDVPFRTRKLIPTAGTISLKCLSRSLALAKLRFTNCGCMLCVLHLYLAGWLATLLGRQTLDDLGLVQLLGRFWLFSLGVQKAGLGLLMSSHRVGLGWVRFSVWEQPNQ